MFCDTCARAASSCACGDRDVVLPRAHFVGTDGARIVHALEKCELVLQPAQRGFGDHGVGFVDGSCACSSRLSSVKSGWPSLTESQTFTCTLRDETGFGHTDGDVFAERFDDARSGDAVLVRLGRRDRGRGPTGVRRCRRATMTVVAAMPAMAR